MSSPFGNWPDANKVWRFINCVQQVEHNEQNWDPIYCTEVITLMTLSMINFVIVAILLTGELKKNGCSKKTLKRVKTWLLIFMLCMYAVIIVRMTFVPSLLGQTVYNSLVYLGISLRQLIILCIFEFYI